MRYFLNLRWPENLPDEVGKPLSNPEEPIDQAKSLAVELRRRSPSLASGRIQRQGLRVAAPGIRIKRLLERADGYRRGKGRR
jgi:hypothetical protein